MKLFGWKSGRDESRPVLSRALSAPGFQGAFGDVPYSYEAQVRAGYLGNAIVQRAVKLVVECVGSAPLLGSDPALVALVTARSGGQALVETVAAQMLLHGNAYVQVLRDVDGGAAELFALRPERVAVEADASGWPAAYRYRVGERVTRLHADSVPGLEEAPLSAPRMTVVAAGSGAAWRQAALLYSVDDGVSWAAAGATAAPAVLGTIAVAASGAPATLVDRRGAFEVVLAHADMELGDADAAALDRGVNLALIGDELVQFGRAEPLGGTRWRLSGLLRGRRGSEAAAGAQMVGDRFVLLQAEAARTFDLPPSVLGREVRVMASGVGDATPVETRCVMRGASVVPPSPVHLRCFAEADGSATVKWTRRSRAGWRWIDGVDAPLSEEVEVYRVTVTAGGTAREVELAVPFVAVTAAERAASASVAVRQRGIFGESLAADLIVPA